MTRPTPELSIDPPVGLGTGDLSGASCVDAVETALEAGYRHVDTARVYDNEAAVGEALARSTVDREAVTVATKVHSSDLAPADVRRSVARSLDRLGVDAIDLLYVHWPAHAYDPAATLGTFAELREEGLVRHVGLCNVTVEVLAEAIRVAPVPVAAVQVEYHPHCRPDDVLAFARAAGIRVIGYSPLAGGRAPSLSPVRTVADRRRATPVQVCLAWLLARGVTPIPQATGDHVRENLAARSVDLSQSDVAIVESVDRRERLTDYPFAPWNE